MSEIYLTKIERKTIFTKSLIFVLIVFIISDLTITGPFYINFIPWIFILGLIGSIKKIDSILICVISTFTVFISSLIMQGEINFTCTINTIINVVTLIFGILTGNFIYEFILEHRLVKYIPKSKKVVYIVLSIIMLFVSWIMISLNNGNIVTYLKSRANLKSYIQATYNTDEFRIKKAQYVKSVPGKYVYTVEMEGHNVYFVPITKDTFKDSGKEARLIGIQHNMRSELTGKVNRILAKYPNMKHANVVFTLEYNAICIVPDTVVMNIDYITENNGQNIDELYEEMANFIQDIQGIKKTQKIIITVGENMLQISEENIQKTTAEYIKNGLDIEEIIE